MFDFEKLKDELFAAGKDVSDMLSEVSEKTRIKLDIRNKEDFLEKQFTGLGKAFYENETDFEEVKENYFKTIKETQEEITRLENELLATQGLVECTECGLKQNKDHSFCSGCGAKLPEIKDKTEEKEDTVMPEATSTEEVAQEPATVEEKPDNVISEGIELAKESVTAETTSTEAASTEATASVVEATTDDIKEDK